VRIALGARHWDVLKAVLGSVAVTIGAGLFTGTAFAFALHRFASSLIVRTGSDAFVLAGAALVLIAVAAVACLIPAHRATTVDPVKALRYG
jgi:ABC-type antimicrobial peptide transport system permease subunit